VAGGVVDLAGDPHALGDDGEAAASSRSRSSERRNHAPSKPVTASVETVTTQRVTPAANIGD
jgi:hypothetical protein